MAAILFLKYLAANITRQVALIFFQCLEDIDIGDQNFDPILSKYVYTLSAIGSLIGEEFPVGFGFQGIFGHRHFWGSLQIGLALDQSVS